ncbi:MAG: recombinase RecT [Prevotella sp.]|nr:recombinase RecT [Bacteroides sp.]MCM1445869.1 recombinase RecT [Prevotella sp.]
MQGNQITTQPKQSAVAVFEAAVKSDFIDQQLTSALAENKGAFVSSLIELYTGDKSLQSCNPKLVALEAVKAASLNLPINKALGFAYIVVYNNNVKQRDPQTGRDVWVNVPTPTFILGYKGFIQLASRTGQYRTINATPVYEGELKRQDRLTGAIDISGTKTSDKIIGYAGYIEYLNGFSKAEYVSVIDMAKHALKHSPSVPKSTKLEDLIALANKEPEAKKVGWLGNFNDMAVKTLIRRLISKYGYMSVQMQAMQKALSIESEPIISTAADRNEQIEAAEEEVVNIDNAEYIDVDPETGEVKETKTETAAEAPKADATPDPGY